MRRNLAFVVFGLFLAALAAAHVRAQDAVLSDFYGAGVHNFYERDYAQAMTNLSAAIDGGSKDPRTYYYRSLAHLRMGNTSAAERDMRKGAALESADVDQFYAVGKALERVQGAERRTLERYRALARAEARQRQMQRDAARYELRRRGEAQVLRSGPVGPPPAPLEPPGVRPAAAAEASPEKPVAKPAEKDEGDPFGTATAEEEMKAEADAPPDDNPEAADKTDDPFSDENPKQN